MNKITATYNLYAEAVAFINRKPLSSKEAIVVLLRHGKTRFNEAHKLQSWDPDIDELSPAGEKCARQLQEPLNLLPISWIASSDLYRAIQTTRLAAPKASFQLCSCLRDLNFGDIGGLKYWEGPENEFKQKYPTAYETWKNGNKRTFTAPGGESYLDFETRVRQGFFTGILPNCLGQVSLIIAHFGTVREILYEIFKSNVNEMKISIDNASITIIHFTEDGNQKLLLFNNTEHLMAKT
ncbi:hypothetical protein A2276_06860 [candidate division WOR-1 bacterium RIFOXYA12_FULL_43_27]|uniref:Phosphoglycerate mutase n=1 Tax=candidate division WOR-1 bacterium RIFOXYC2_FULL_46_14 TaxID=1802587 RepID=A0A1F4U7E1_UNCSA|nr:MAG: hypothetical protein A2276_06860 [candidate division WOR-1 bacterium RIFOXYA12_FULL_43_27]OGC20367.1 MAG: hypothetical protein A2292_04860 [candidate division WOR-1 bacterium RIFOXYB2_FULL_46_45]OGC31896.1 MAG: hypothetical protein A2232_06590 [candidate division WOR-1 bacterium RIFOXYA2_FULL_46_56]OGC40213.1 MAG: hypothetical protein A2438_02880 [candidate division WOR-1 bacterium RIFOXYC2_FULL_46_14]